MRIRRPASQKCRSIPITAVVQPVILLPMNWETPGLTDHASADLSSAGSTVDTSAIENAIRQATSDLADLQSDLLPQKSIAEADSASLTEEKEKNACQQQSY